jgi:RNA polymerase sigma factor (sigma-70 family)
MWLQFVGDSMEAGALRAPAGLNRISVTAPLLRLRSDEQLVALFRAGNDVAFSVIHDRYRQRLFAYSRQMLGGSRQDAEDALQDVFLRAYSSLRSSDRPLSLRAWLYKVAHNRCIDHLRKPAPLASDLFDTSRRPLHDPIEQAERRDDLRQLVEDVRRLPEQQRSALLMREMDGLSYAELADALGVSLPAVKSLLVRARIGLVEAVEARETACSDIRGDLVDAFDRGVRASGRARRHLRDCAGCVEYRTQLRAIREGFQALTPNPGLLAAALKLLGLGGAGSAGAASAGGGAAAGGGVIAIAGGGTAAKVAAVVCCAALTAGGAAEVTSLVTPASSSGGAAKRSGGSAAASAQQRTIVPVITPAVNTRDVRIGAPDSAPARAAIPDSARKVTAGRTVDGPAASSVAEHADAVTGGVTAPNEDTGFGHGVDGLTPVAPTTSSAQPDSTAAATAGSSLGAADHAPSATGVTGSSAGGGGYGVGAGGTGGGAQAPAPQ